MCAGFFLFFKTVSGRTCQNLMMIIPSYYIGTKPTDNEEYRIQYHILVHRTLALAVYAENHRSSKI